MSEAGDVELCCCGRAQQESCFEHFMRYMFAFAAVVTELATSVGIAFASSTARSPGIAVILAGLRQGSHRDTDHEGCMTVDCGTRVFLTDCFYAKCSAGERPKAAGSKVNRPD